MGTTRDDQFLALPEEASNFDFGLQVDYGFNPNLYYEYGVLASGSFNGVFGQAGSGNGRGFRLCAGVVGWSQQEPGVLGWSRNNNGVDAESVSGPGLSAVSFWGPAVSAVSGTVGVRALAQNVGISGNGFDGAGVMGGSGPGGTQGPTVPNTSNIAGVVGSSDRQHGVIGTTNTNVGVIGFSTNNIAVLGYTIAGPFAGYFIGNLGVTGTKSAVVPFPDGTHRALYCMESPELWFEDFGTAKLKSGRAVVELDADFAKVIKRGDYHVFFTPRGDCRGLYVRRQGGARFEVRESQHGKSSVAFSYRIIGRRKDVKAFRRFAKVDARLPTAPARSGRRPKIRPPTPTGLRAFAARMEKQSGTRALKRGRK